MSYSQVFTECHYAECCNPNVMAPNLEHLG
jgi:hypothetical protein